MAEQYPHRRRNRHTRPAAPHSTAAADHTGQDQLIPADLRGSSPVHRLVPVARPHLAFSCTGHGLTPPEILRRLAPWITERVEAIERGVADATEMGHERGLTGIEPHCRLDEDGHDTRLMNAFGETEPTRDANAIHRLALIRAYTAAYSRARKMTWIDVRDGTEAHTYLASSAASGADDHEIVDRQQSGDDLTEPADTAAVTPFTHLTRAAGGVSISTRQEVSPPITTRRIDLFCATTS
jgi:hypothetical protein